MDMIVDVLAVTAAAIVAVVAFLALRYRAPDHSVYDSPKTAPVIADADVSPEHDDVVRTLAEFNRNNTSKDIHVTRKRMEDLFYRDVKYLFEIVISVWMFATSVVYPIGRVGGKLGAVLALNPMTHLIDAFRAVLLEHRAPDPAFAVTVAASLALFLGAWIAFHLAEVDFAENL